MRYMLPAALKYPSGDGNGFPVYRPAGGGRSCEHFGRYKNINNYTTNNKKEMLRRSWLGEE